MLDEEDFLDQCKPRMQRLIEAGISGKLEEKLLEECLSQNDALLSVLKMANEPPKNRPDVPVRDDLMDFVEPVPAAPAAIGNNNTTLFQGCSAGCWL